MPRGPHEGLGSASVPQSQASGPGGCPVPGTVAAALSLARHASGNAHTRGLDLGRGHQQASRTCRVQRGRPIYVCEESAYWPRGALHAGSCPRPPPASPTPAVKSFLGARPRGRRADGQPDRAACRCHPPPRRGPVSEALSATLCTPAWVQQWAWSGCHLGSCPPSVLKCQLPERRLHLRVRRRAWLSGLRGTPHVSCITGG